MIAERIGLIDVGSNFVHKLQMNLSRTRLSWSCINRVFQADNSQLAAHDRTLVMADSRPFLCVFPSVVPPGNTWTRDAILVLFRNCWNWLKLTLHFSPRLWTLFYPFSAVTLPVSVITHRPWLQEVKQNQGLAWRCLNLFGALLFPQNGQLYWTKDLQFIL